MLNDWKSEPHFRRLDHENRLQPKHARIPIDVARHRGGAHEHLMASPFEISAKRFDGYLDAMCDRQVAVREEANSQTSTHIGRGAWLSGWSFPSAG
jgi:hypothetical protein